MERRLMKFWKEVDAGITRNIPGFVRASFSIMNNYEDVEKLVHALDEISQHTQDFYHNRYKKNEITGEWGLKK